MLVAKYIAIFSIIYSNLVHTCIKTNYQRFVKRTLLSDHVQHHHIIYSVIRYYESTSNNKKTSIIYMHNYNETEN